MNKLYALLALIAAIIVFVMGYNALKSDNLREGVLFLSVAIVLFVSAGTLKISMQIRELRDEITRNPDAPAKSDDKIV
jgi:hypothetical protein